MGGGVETSATLVATAEGSVSDVLPFAIMGSWAIVQNLRKNILVSLYVVPEGMRREDARPS